MIFPALSLSIYLLIASIYMLFFMRLRAFALASSTSSTSSVLLLHYLCSRGLSNFVFAVCVCGYKNRMRYLFVTCICVKSKFTAAIIFLRENYAKLLRVVQWINFV